MTLLAEKLKAAGVKDDVLYLAAVEALRRSHGNVDRALELFRQALTVAARDMKIEPRGVDQGGRATSAPAPTTHVSPRDLEAKRQAALSVASVGAKTILDTYAVRGRAIGDIPYREWQDIVRVNGVESRVVRAMLRHIREPSDPNMTARDLFKPEQIVIFIEQAERANATD